MTRKDDFTCVIFTGLPGSGKTTCGAILSKRLGLSFCDTDKLIESSESLKIKEIFARYGEARFRSMEKEVLRLLEIGFADRNNLVPSPLSSPIFQKLRERMAVEVERALSANGLIIAVGGGVPEPDDNRDALRRLGTVTYLEAQPEEIAARLKDDGARPLLSQEESEPPGLLSSEKDSGEDLSQENAKGQTAKNHDLLSRLKMLLDRRRQAYESADIKIDTTGLSPHQIVNLVEEALKTHLKI